MSTCTRTRLGAIRILSALAGGVLLTMCLAALAGPAATEPAERVPIEPAPSDQATEPVAPSPPSGAMAPDQMPPAVPEAHASAPAASSQPAPAGLPEPEPPVDFSLALPSLFDNLANPDPTARDHALTTLMGMKADDLPQLQKLVQTRSPLAPAERAMLRQIVTHVYLSGLTYTATPNGFLGVQISLAMANFRGESPAASGVFIIDRVPGFIAARMLRDGDMVLSILERPDAQLVSAEAFREAVSGLPAGTVTHFQILRQGRIIWVAVKLDAHPNITDQFSLEKFKEDRRSEADHYWDEHFAHLVPEEVAAQ